MNKVLVYLLCVRVTIVFSKAERSLAIISFKVTQMPNLQASPSRTCASFIVLGLQKEKKFFFWQIV